MRKNPPKPIVPAKIGKIVTRGGRLEGVYLSDGRKLEGIASAQYNPEVFVNNATGEKAGGLQAIFLLEKSLVIEDLPEIVMATPGDVAKVAPEGVLAKLMKGGDA